MSAERNLHKGILSSGLMRREVIGGNQCKFGYSLRGFPPVCHRLLARGKRISAIAAIRSEGILGVELTTGTVDGDKFVDFIRGTLIPNMHAYDVTSSKSVVVMDNCAIHHIPEVLEDAGILCFFATQQPQF